MSYCRFSQGDVYLFENVYGYFDCCGCKLRGMDRFLTRRETLAHLEEHRSAGHDVPQYAIDRLQEELKTIGNYIVDSVSNALDVSATQEELI
jgi:hypothetical protein